MVGAPGLSRARFGGPVAGLSRAGGVVSGPPSLALRPGWSFPPSVRSSFVGRGGALAFGVRPGVLGALRGWGGVSPAWVRCALFAGRVASSSRLRVVGVLALFGGRGW